LRLFLEKKKRNEKEGRKKRRRKTEWQKLHLKTGKRSTSEDMDFLDVGKELA
jgi:hypothetical protein